MNKKTKFLSIGTIIGMGVVCLIFFLSPLYEIIFPQSSNIANFHYKNTDYYNFAKGTLENLDHSGYVYPNDRVVYDVILGMKKPERVNMTAQLTYLVGDKVIDTAPSYHNLLLGAHEGPFIELQYQVSPREEGVNHIRLHMDFFNKNGTYLESDDEDTSFQVLSLVSKLQLDQNDNIRNGIIITGIFSSIAVAFTGYQTMTSRNEKNQTIRAWIGETGSHMILLRYFNKNGGIKTREEWDKMSEIEKDDFNFSDNEYAIMIKNFGQIPATNVSGRYLSVLNRMPMRQEISSSEFEFFSVILPNDEKYHLFHLNRETTDAISDGSKQVYFIFEVRYNFGRSKKEHKFGFIANFSHGMYTKIDTWDEESFDKKP